MICTRTHGPHRTAARQPRRSLPIVPFTALAQASQVGPAFRSPPLIDDGDAVPALAALD